MTNPFFAVLEAQLRVASACAQAVIDVAETSAEVAVDAAEVTLLTPENILRKCKNIFDKNGEDYAKTAREIASELRGVGKNPHVPLCELEALNGDWLEEDQEGHLTPTKRNLAELFPADGKIDHKKQPDIIITSNTVATMNEEQHLEIMRGLLGIYNKANENVDDLPEPIFLSAMHSKKTIPENSAVLFERWARLLEGNRNMGYITPDSVQIGNFILSCLLETPEAIDLTRPSDSIIERFADIPSPVKPEYKAKPLVLRKDALDIAKHIKPVGYSRGSTVVMDAMRYVARCLEHTREDKVRGIEGIALDIHVHDRDSGEVRPLERKDTVKLVSAMPVVTFAGQSNPLNHREKMMGLRRVSIVNKHDGVIGFLVKKFSDQHGTHDLLVQVEGVAGPSHSPGHDPKDAMPYGDKVGYIWQDRQARRFLQTLLGRDRDRAIVHSDPLVGRMVEAFANDSGASLATQ